MEPPCPHTLCKHLGNGKMECVRCGAIEPVMVTTIRVKAEDYESLQRLYTHCRSLMQARSGPGFMDAMEAISAEVGILPAMIPEQAHHKTSTVEVTDAALKWWRSWSPVGWDDQMHLEHPLVNVTTDADIALADVVARYIKEHK